MARSHLTLAALATSAVEGLEVAAAAPFGTGNGNDFDSALITDRAGKHWIIRVPRNAAAENAQSADLVALRALSAGVRTRLPFDVTSYAGQVPVGQTRGIVYEFVYGNKVPMRSYTTGPKSLSASIGAAIAAIHALPTSFVADAGLPVQTASEALRACISIIDRAAATKLVPGASVVGSQGAPVGTISAIDDQFATLKLTTGKLVKIPRAGLAAGANGPTIGMTATALDAAATAAAAAPPAAAAAMTTPATATP